MTKSKSLIAVALAALTFTATGQIYTAKSGATTISFFSSAPLENIEATNKSATIVYKASTGDLQASVTMKGFKFKNALMEEHFNENYVESEKYPKATFKGKLKDIPDMSKDGEYKVTVTGKMEIHGVTQEVSNEGTITKAGEELRFHSKFPIRVADYKIKVPSMYVKNIAEVVDVTFDTVLEPYKKP